MVAENSPDAPPRGQQQQGQQQGGGGGNKGRSIEPWLRAVLVATPESLSSPGGGPAALCAAPTPQQSAGAQLGLYRMVPEAARLNPSQAEAFKAGLSRRLTLIQGPPGTGKTHTSITIIKQWVWAGMGPVLATSDSNVAVDNLVEGLAKAGLRVVRMGRPEAVRMDLLRHCIDQQPGVAGAANKEEQARAIKDAIRQAQVVCATCSGAGSDMLERNSFPAVLLDEASQATEPSCVVPLCKGARVVALVGDHRQLPPTIANRDAELQGLGTSLFDRLVHLGVEPLMLDTQYRMHPALAHFPSQAFYGGRLASGVRSAARPPPQGFPWPHKSVGLAFVPSEGSERPEGTSHSNAAEAELVAQVVRGILSAGELRPDGIGIVTPYAAQVRHIRRILNVPRRPPADGSPVLEVSSVDGFQGREKEVIVFSAVRANFSGSVGFLGDPRRLNVMLTRAKRGLVVIGHFRTLAAESQFWQPWLRWAQSAGLVHGVAPGDPSAVAHLLSLDAHQPLPAPAPVRSVESSPGPSRRARGPRSLRAIADLSVGAL